jgi:hypothetical protein
VAFFGTLKSGVKGIFTGDGGAVTTVADDSGPFDAFDVPGTITFSAPAINDAGLVVFQAGLDAGGQGIFTGNDPAADKVIQIGDPLFGSTVSGLAFVRGLNNSGDIAFFYELNSGTEGIAVAVAQGDACYPDFTGEGDLDLFDFLGYVNAFNDGEDRADCTEDGALDFFDFLCFTNAFNEGC